MKRIPSLHAGLSSLLVSLVLGAIAPATWAQTQEPVTIPNAQNPNLVANQEVADAQGVNVITTFMTSGTQTCNSQGEDCTGDFGSDDSVNYLNMQAQAQAATGVQGYSFMGGNDETDSDDVSTQQGTLEIACGDISPHMVAGIAVKSTYCTVDAQGDATVTMQVCTGPSYGDAVTTPPNTVQCSTNPSDPTFFPPAGYACARPVCDTQPEGSQYGWSAPFTIVFMASLPAGASTQEQTSNGLGMTFYPPLTSGTTASFSADSQSMTAIQIVETGINSQTQRTAVAMNVAFRSETSITSTELATNTTTNDPSTYSDSWDDILRLQANPLYAQYSGTDEAQGTACLNQIYSGIEGNGTVYVCDPTYNQNGVHPLALSAQVGTQGEDCGTTQQCLSEVVNTTSWTQQCVADVPLAIASCETTTAYTMDQIGLTANQVTEVCQETRAVAQYSCSTTASAGSMTSGCSAGQACSLVETCTPGQTYSVNVSNYGGMGQDACEGGDYITAQWTCPSDPTQMPQITLSTDGGAANGSGPNTVSAVVPNNSSVIDFLGANVDAESTNNMESAQCYGQFTNQTVCNQGQCQGTYTLTIGSYDCPPADFTDVDTGEQDMEGNEIYQPTCSVTLVFTPHSFGAADTLSVPGSFSMAQLMGTTVTDGCAAYEADE
jgi:hypothetical protein